MHSIHSLIPLSLVLLSSPTTLCASAVAPPSDLDILAGQHIIYSWPTSTQPPAQLLSLTKQGLVGGVILFGENVDQANSSATTMYMDSLRAAYASSPAPALLAKATGQQSTSPKFFICTDQEGGQVRRIKNGEPKLSAKQMGSATDPTQAGQQGGAGAAATLTQYGLNANLAPVLDVFRQPGDFEDYYARSFGNSSAQVVAAAVPFIKAQQAAGVAATAKHFPGLGAASHEENTDTEPVTLSQSLAEIRAVDEGPYSTAIAAGIELVMMSWAIYPALDTRPAGLSSKWVQDELRGRLGFKGVVITDAIEAGALSKMDSQDEIAKLAKAAGVDLLLASGRNVTQGEVVRKAVVTAIQSGRLSRTQFDAATVRIASMRSRLVR